MGDELDQMVAVHVQGGYESGGTCRYVDETTNPDTVRVMVITPGEFAACMKQIDELDNELGACFGDIETDTP